MTFKLENPKNDEGFGTGTFMWERAFTILSMRQTEPFWQAMGLSIPPTEKLRRIMQVYVRECFSNSGREQPKDDRLGRPDYPIGKTEEEHWHNTFSRMTQVLGKENTTVIYNWVDHCFENYTDQNNQIASVEWLSLLTTIEHVNDFNKSAFVSPRLYLSNDQLTGLRSIHAGFSDKMKQIDQQLKETLNISRDLWEEYIYDYWGARGLGVLYWVSSQIRFLLWVSEWQEIEQLLGGEGLAKLEEWGRTQLRKSRPEVVLEPIVRFKWER